MFKDGLIDGVIIRPLKRHEDKRGWLSEIFREDEIGKEIIPVMSYVSMTKQGVERGPHEHITQTDFFAFIGSGKFLLGLWDNRKGSPTYQNRIFVIVGDGNPSIAVVPPGVVHGYANIGKTDGLVFNCPNKLFAGHGKKEKIDEVRHEDDRSNPFFADFLSKIEETKKK